MLRTFCPKRKCTITAEKVESWIAEEWQRIDEQHSRDAALCICTCVHDDEQARPKFTSIVRTLQDLRLSIETQLGSTRPGQQAC
eukprot:174033-Amphidinium_carterae.1